MTPSTTTPPHTADKHHKGHEECPPNYTLWDEKVIEHICSHKVAPPASTVSEVEAQRTGKLELGCEKTTRSWSLTGWQGNSRKTWTQYCRPIAWLATIALISTILTAYQFGSNYIVPRLRCQDQSSQMFDQDLNMLDRDVTRHETYKSIHGTFRVYDSLTLTTTTGSIHATIDLVPLDPRVQTENGNQQPLRPVNIYIATTTGSVHIGFTGQSRVNAHNRALFVTIRTETGSTHATDILVGNGGTTELTTSTGGTHPSFLVIGAGPQDPISHLITRTSAKSQHVTVRAFQGGTGEQATLAGLRSDHRTTASGSLHVTYPSTWEGKVEAMARIGGLHMKGRDLMCQPEGDGLFGKKEVCYKLTPDRDGRNLETSIFLACEGVGSVHFTA